MAQEMPEAVWLTCPQCSSRIEVRPGRQTEVRCSHCKRRFVVTPGAKQSDPPKLTAAPSTAPDSGPVSFAPAAKTVAARAIAPPADDDEFRVAPPSERTGYVDHIPKPHEVVERPPPEEYVPPPREPSLAWAFTSDVFNFPWTRGAISQWIVLSLGLFVTAELLVFAGRAYAAGGREGIVGAGCIFIAAFFIGLFSLSYAAASMVRIIENTAYNMDAESDWPDADWRDRFFHLVRMLYLGVLSTLVAAGTAWVVSPTGSVLLPMYVAQVVMLLVFPVLLLSTLETNSLSPFSPPVLRSLVRLWYVWAGFYVLSIVMGVCLVLVATALYGVAGALAPFITEPLDAAAIFIYARLLGRVAWLLMNQGESERKSDRLRGAAPRSARTARDFILARREEGLDPRE